MQLSQKDTRRRNTLKHDVAKAHIGSGLHALLISVLFCFLIRINLTRTTNAPHPQIHLSFPKITGAKQLLMNHEQGHSSSSPAHRILCQAQSSRRLLFRYHLPLSLAFGTSCCITRVLQDILCGSLKESRVLVRVYPLKFFNYCEILDSVLVSWWLGHAGGVNASFGRSNHCQK